MVTPLRARKAHGVPDWAGRAPSAPLGEDALNDILLAVQDRFAWERRARRFELVNAWSSRTADLYRCRGEGADAPDVVLKIVPGWDAETGRAVWGSMVVIDGVLRERSGCRVVPPLGWTSAPPGLCTEHVAGTDVFFLLSDLDHPAAPGSTGLPEVIAECGRALGAYHAASPASAGAYRDLQLRSIARSMGVRERLLRTAIGDAIRLSFDDFGPHQFRLGDDEVLYVLDTPVSPLAAPVYSDIAQFLFGMLKILGTTALRRPPRSLGVELSRAFCAGYSSTGPVNPLSARHRWLVDLYFGYVAAGTAHKRLRQRRYAAALGHGSQWLAKVVAARRGPEA